MFYSFWFFFFSVCWATQSIKNYNQKICRRSSGRPMGREIYPGTKCNSVPLFIKWHILFDVFFVPVRCSVFMFVTVTSVCGCMATIHLCLSKSSRYEAIIVAKGLCVCWRYICNKCVYIALFICKKKCVHWDLSVHKNSFVFINDHVVKAHQLKISKSCTQSSNYTQIFWRSPALSDLRLRLDSRFFCPEFRLTNIARSAKNHELRAHSKSLTRYVWHWFDHRCKL